MKVLITGGCGFVGVNLVKYLSARGYAIRILDDLSTGKREYIENLSLREEPEYIIGDVRDEEAVDRAGEGVDAVVHLAALTSVVESLENPVENWEINVGGTFNLLEACRRKGVERFIFASSNAVAGEQEPPIDEMKVPQPLSPYGASKLAGEGLSTAYFHSFGIKTVSLRFANLYGPYSDDKTSVIALFMQWTKKGEPFIIYGDGNQTRDFVHVDDICQAVEIVLGATESSLWGEIFQIASGMETSINELVRIIGEVTGKDVQAIYEPERTGEIKRNYSDISKARKVLGFEPEVKLKEGLKGL